MLTDNPRSFAALAGALGLVLFFLGFTAGWFTGDSSRALARAVPLAAAPGAVEVTRPGAAEPLPGLRSAPAPRKTRPTTTAKAAPAPTPPQKRRAPKPVTIVGTG